MSVYAQGEYSGWKEKEVICWELAKKTFSGKLGTFEGAVDGGICPIASCSQVRF